ncbi:hypothetical protein ABT297_32030 [Dactylosporangium sp. NPDC000555]|uniref:hypothetical protein n=1 Tax=Dactylosporangium sp. NPDC000555 TaxID=3154260 RepID=UPI00331D3DAD
MRRTILRLLGISLAVTALITYVNWSGDRDAARFNPAAQLHCAHGTQIAGARATAAPTAHETRDPGQLAAAWARTRAPELIAGQRQLFDSTDRVDIGFDHQARTVAVLTFRADKRAGWYLDAVVACQNQVTPSGGQSHSPSAR